MKSYRIISVIGCGFLPLLSLFASPALAKLASPGDLPYVVERDATEMTVQASGEYRMVRESLIRIANDQGRESQSVQSLQFNSRSQTLRIIEAATLNGPPEKAVKTVVPARDIEIKEIGEMSQAFDSIKQASLSYPNVQVGSRLLLKYELINKEVALKNFWSVGFSVAGDYIEKFEFRVRSKLPLHVNVRDGEKRLAQTPVSKKNGWNELRVYSTSAIATQTIQEEFPFLRPERIPAISVSSLPDWSNYAREMIPVHERLLAPKLPPLLEDIKKKADLEKTSVDKIQRVMALVAQEFRYFGDWRRRHGGYVPRSLNEIATSRYGDCKDLSLAVTAIYRALGYKAHLAWIYRGDISPSESTYKIPVDTSFNHAVAKVEADGQTFWIDATNPVAYARGVFPDIADRPAFVLNPQAPKLERTPALKAEDAVYSSDLSYALQDDDTVKVSGEAGLAGRLAIGLTARAFYSPVDVVNYELIRTLANNGKVTDTFVGGFDRGTRIVQDIKIPVRFTLSETGLRTSAGIGFPLMRDDSVSRLLSETKDRVSDIHLESPATSRSIIRLLNVRKVGSLSLDCAIENEFASFKREVKEAERGVTIADTVVVKKSVVPVEVLSTAAFEKFQDGLRSCFNRAAVVLEKR